jgi:hypothetical protein
MADLLGDLRQEVSLVSLLWRFSFTGPASLLSIPSLRCSLVFRFFSSSAPKMLSCIAQKLYPSALQCTFTLFRYPLVLLFWDVYSTAMWQEFMKEEDGICKK